MNIPKNSLLDSGSLGSENLPTGAVVVDRDKTSSTKWVKCFGFPPGQSDIVLQYFEQVRGLTIVDYQPKGDLDANWVHVKFASPKDTALALGVNNSIIMVNGARLMIGIILYPEGDQLDAVSKATKDSSSADKRSVTVTAGGGPRRASTIWEKAAAWVMDM